MASLMRACFFLLLSGSVLSAAIEECVDVDGEAQCLQAASVSLLQKNFDIVTKPGASGNSQESVHASTKGTHLQTEHAQGEHAHLSLLHAGPKKDRMDASHAHSQPSQGVAEQGPPPHKVARMADGSVPIAKTNLGCCILVAGAIFAVWASWAYFQGMPSEPLGLDSLATKIVFPAYSLLCLCSTFLTKSMEAKGPDTKVLVASCFVSKMLVSLGLWRIQDGSFVELVFVARREWRSLSKYVVIALLFAVSDVLRLDFIQLTSPSSYHVLINLRAFFLVWIWQVVMGYQLLRRHWFSIACISIGCVVKEAPRFFAQGSLFPGPGLATAYFELLCLMVCTSLGLVMNELLLKRPVFSEQEPTPLNLQNIALYLFGFSFMLLQALFSAFHWGVEESAVFQIDEWRRVLSPLPCLWLACFTALGIVTSHFLKRLSNIAKEVANGVEVLISLPLDTAIFGTHLGPVELIGSGLVLFGIDIFARWPIGAGPSPKDGASGGARDLLEKRLPVPEEQHNEKPPPEPK